jgi:hypothetical protein
MVLETHLLVLSLQQSLKEKMSDQQLVLACGFLVKSFKDQAALSLIRTHLISDL